MIIDGNYTRTDEVHGEEVRLDLRVATLLGFHKGVDKDSINSMLEAIARNCVFPSVKIVQVGVNCYAMAFLINPEDGKPDGGHHRAYAHYCANKLLRCEIVPARYKAHNATIPIQQMVCRE